MPRSVKLTLTCVFVTFIVLAGNIRAIEGQEDLTPQLPTGNWTLTAQPYVGPGYDTRPVVVISVTTDFKQGLTISEVGLKNISSKPVIGVKLSWYLSNEQNPTSTLLQGETPLVAISGGIPVGKRKLLSFPVASFAKIYKPLLSGTTLSGDYRIEVGVSEILYEDGSTTTVSINNDRPERTTDIIRTAKNFNNTRSIKAVRFIPTAAQIACPRQKCKYVSTGGSHFECEAAPTDPVYCNNRQSSYCNVLCGEKPPGPGDFLEP